MRAAVGLLVAYALAAVAVSLVWTCWARTENQPNQFGSIVAIADGTAPLPFVKRRLLVDTARLLARAVPDAAWSCVSDAIATRPALDHLVREKLRWPRRDDPLLLSATALIALSAFGFMLGTRAIIQIVYDTPPFVASVSGLLLGLALLGGGSEASYGYPYDIPHACVFAWALVALLARSLWLLPIFAAAAYSKETAVLLIPAAVLVHRGPVDRRLFVNLAAMTGLFILVRKMLDHTYGAGSGGFWFPGRNARLILWSLVFGSWLIPVALVMAARIVRLWNAFPLRLRRLAVLAVVPLGLAFFKGWVEERRQYLELLPIIGPLAIQWSLTELGLERFCRVRPEP